jgi:DNA-directed RNA polymerase subunit beta'
MMATHNIFSPSSGKPILTPSQDIVLGSYFLTLDPPVKPKEDERLPLIVDADELETAVVDGALNVHDWINFINPDFENKNTVYGKPEKKVIRTTVGRVIFNTIWPDEVGFNPHPRRLAPPKSKFLSVATHLGSACDHLGKMDSLPKCQYCYILLCTTVGEGRVTRLSFCPLMEG